MSTRKPVIPQPATYSVLVTCRRVLTSVRVGDTGIVYCYDDTFALAPQVTFSVVHPETDELSPWVAVVGCERDGVVTAHAFDDEDLIRDDEDECGEPVYYHPDVGWVYERTGNPVAR